MKLVLLLSIISLVSGYLYDLKDISTTVFNAPGWYPQFFVVPYGDKEADIVKVVVNCGSGVNAEYPTNASLVKEEGGGNGSGDCQINLSEEPSTPLTGKIYFVSKDYLKDKVVTYQSKQDDDDFIVTSDSTYIVIFSLNGGVSLSSLDGSDHNFTIFSGLPGDDDSKPLFVFSSKMDVDKFYIEEDHFYIQTVHQVKLLVEDKKVDITENEFKTNGFLLTPGYPNIKPTEKYLNYPVKLESKSNERLITFQVSVGSGQDPAGVEGAVLASTSSSFIKIACGEYEILVYEGASVQFNYPLPADSSHFTISADTSYLVQFDVTDSASPSPSTAASPHTNAVTCPTATAVPCTTCPPVTPCPNTTQSASTCPVVDCQCPTTTVTSTPVSTTTQSASSSAVTAVFVLMSLTLL